jgi:hypothetical protein
MLDDGDHEVANLLGRYAAGCRDEPHGLTITAVEREGDADLLAIVAGDLETIGAPAAVACLDRDLAIVPSFLTAPAMSLKQQALKLHDAVDALGIGRCAPVLFGLATQQRVNAAIAVGRQIQDERADVGDEFGVRGWRSSTALWGATMPHRREVRT